MKIFSSADMFSFVCVQNKRWSIAVENYHKGNWQTEKVVENETFEPKTLPWGSGTVYVS